MNGQGKVVSGINAAIQSLGWRSTSAITSAQSALGVSVRSVADIGSNLGAGKYGLLSTSGWGDFYKINALELAVLGSANNDSNTLEIYSAREDSGVFSHVAQLSVTIGQLPKGSYFYADTMTVTIYDRMFFAKTVQASGTDERARLVVQTNGYSKFLFIASTLNSTSLTLEGAFCSDFPRGLYPDNFMGLQSTAGGTQKLTIATNVAQGSSQLCHGCCVSYSGTGPVAMQIGATADADDMPIPTTPFPVGIDNLNKLHFYSATNGDIVNIIWRN